MEPIRIYKREDEEEQPSYMCFWVFVGISVGLIVNGFMMEIHKITSGL